LKNLTRRSVKKFNCAVDYTFFDVSLFDYVRDILQINNRRIWMVKLAESPIFNDKFLIISDFSLKNRDGVEFRPDPESGLIEMPTRPRALAGS
jgi:hypothetical protein